MWERALDAVKAWEADNDDADQLDRHVTELHGALDSQRVPAEQRAGARYHLGQALRRRYIAATGRADLDAAIGELRAAVEATSDDDPDYPGRATALAALLVARGSGDGDRAGVEAGVGLARHIVDSGRRHQQPVGPALNALAIGLVTLSEAFGVTSEVDAAITVARSALAEELEAGDRVDALLHLGTALAVRHRARGEISDIEQAVEQLRGAVDLTEESEESMVQRPLVLSRLVFALLQRFEATEDRADLDEAVEWGRVAAAATTPGHLLAAPMHLALALALSERWEAPRSRPDLDEAIAAAWVAWEGMPVDNPERESAGGLLTQLTWSKAHHWYGAEALDEVIRAERAVGGEGSSDLLSAQGLRAALTGDGDAHDQVVASLRAAIGSAPDDASRAELVAELGTILLSRATPDSVASGLELLEEALVQLPLDSSKRSGLSLMVAGGLALRAGNTGSRDDAETAVSLAMEAIEHHRGSTLEATAYNTAGTALTVRYQLLGHRADIEAAVVNFRTAVDQTPGDDPTRSTPLAGLSQALLQLHRLTGDEGALITCIQAAEAAVVAAFPQHQSIARLQLAAALQARADHSGDPRDAQQAEKLEQQAQRLSQLQSLPVQAEQWETINRNHLARYHHTGEIRHLDEAIQIYRRALARLSEAVPERARLLVCLSQCLLARHERTRRPDDIDAAVGAAEEAIDLQASPRQQAITRGVLGQARSARFEATGDLAEIERAIDELRKADATLVEEGGVRVVALGALSTALVRQSERTGDIAAVHGAVAAAQMACDLPDVAVELRPACLTGLATAQWNRYLALGDDGDLDSAVAHQTQALALVPPASPARFMHLHNLGGLLLQRHDRSGELADLDAAIAVSEQALDLLPRQHPDRPGVESGRAILLLERAGATDDVATLQQSVAAGRRSMERSQGAARASGQHVYAQALLTHAEAAGGGIYLWRALRALKASLRSTPEHHPLRAARLSTLAAALELRYRRSERRRHRRAALAAADEAAASVTASSEVRLRACQMSGHLHHLTGNTAHAAAAYRTAVEEVLPLLAWRGLGLVSRENRLRDFPGLASDAAAVALDAGDPARALRLLEQGRTLIWSQLLDARTDRSRLAAEHPELCRRLDHLVAELADTDDGFGRSLSAGATVPGATPYRQDVEYRWQLHRDHEELLAEVRQQPGFEDFLAAPELATLRRSAARGPVVVVNVSAYRCDALLLTPDHDDVRVVPLPALDATDVESRAQSFAAAVDTVDTTIDPPSLTAASSHITDTMTWLWHAIAQPVLDHLDLPPGEGDALPRLWWCPTGQLARLPLHAAGDSTTQDWVGGRVIPSYTPTLGTLVRNCDHEADGIEDVDDPPTGALIVGVADAPPIDGTTFSTLSSVREEVELVARHLAGPHTILQAADATRERILEALRHHTLLHFACHGHQHVTNPAASYLAVADGPLRLQEIVGQLRNNTQLAFLSACDTAQGHPDLADETLHLAAAFGFSGARHIIGTLWSIDDATAPTIARDTYAAIAAAHDEAGFDGTAVALHHAIGRLRQRPDTSAPVHWASYAHFGS